MIQGRRALLFLIDLFIIAHSLSNKEKEHPVYVPYFTLSRHFDVTATSSIGKTTFSSFQFVMSHWTARNRLLKLETWLMLPKVVALEGDNFIL